MHLWQYLFVLQLIPFMAKALPVTDNESTVTNPMFTQLAQVLTTGMVAGLAMRNQKKKQLSQASQPRAQPAIPTTIGGPNQVQNQQNTPAPKADGQTVGSPNMTGNVLPGAQNNSATKNVMMQGMGALANLGGAFLMGLQKPASPPLGGSMGNNAVGLGTNAYQPSTAVYKRSTITSPQPGESANNRPTSR